MQTVSAVMSRNPRSVAPGASLQHTAQLMGELDVGALPVCEGGLLVGMVTDRDIAVRGAAAGKAPQTAHVDEVMSTDVRWCFEDQPLDDVMAQMAASQVRRVPVLSHGDQRLVGIVALADLSLKAMDEGRVEQVVDSVSPPAGAAPAQGQTSGKNANGVQEALTGIDERADGRDKLVGMPGVTGQQRVDDREGEPLRNAGSTDPADRAGQAADTDGRSPPSN